MRPSKKSKTLEIEKSSSDDAMDRRLYREYTVGIYAGLKTWQLKNCASCKVAKLT